MVETATELERHESTVARLYDRRLALQGAWNAIWDAKMVEIPVTLLDELHMETTVIDTILPLMIVRSKKLGELEEYKTRRVIIALKGYIYG